MPRPNVKLDKMCAEDHFAHPGSCRGSECIIEVLERSRTFAGALDGNVFAIVAHQLGDGCGAIHLWDDLSPDFDDESEAKLVQQGRGA